jgi:DNA-binding transcriptional ArsR family regulator
MNKKYDVFAAIGDPTRRQILFLLTTGALSINVIADNFEISRPAVSKHVKMLHGAGLIAIEENGRERYCALNPTGFNEIRDWLGFYEQFWGDKLSKLGEVMDEYAKKTSKKG